MIEELHYFLEKGNVNEVIAYLKRLTINERRSVVPELEKRRYNNYKWNFENNPFILERQKVLEVAFFICMDKTHIQNYPRYELPDNDVIDDILEWYTPPWFSDYFNKIKFLPYNYLMKWRNEGYLKPEKELIAKSLPSAVWIKEPYKIKGYFSIEMLDKYPETLKKHIWYLFEYETNIVIYDKSSGFENPKEEKIWTNALKKYIDEGRIKRSVVLKKSLLAISNCSNKELLKWFAVLFITLKPSKQEIFSCSKELLNIFSYNSMAEELLELLYNEVVVLLFNNDKSVQYNAAYIINKFGDSNSPRIREALNPYVNTIPSSVKSLLSAWL